MSADISAWYYCSELLLIFLDIAAVYQGASCLIKDSYMINSYR